MKLPVFDIAPFKEIRREFKQFPKELHIAYGTLPGRTRLQWLREISSGLLNKIAPLALALSTIEVIKGPLGSQIEDLADRFSFEAFGSSNLLIGALAIKETSLAISYFTVYALITSLAATVLSKMIAPHPQNEQSRSLNTIRHLWGDLAKTLQKTKNKQKLDEDSFRKAINYVSTLENLKDSYPREFNQTLRPITSWNLIDPQKFAKLKGLIYLYLYNLTHRIQDLESSRENFTSGKASDPKGLMQQWFNSEKTVSMLQNTELRNTEPLSQ